MQPINILISTPMNIILASRSPARRALMRKLAREMGFAFKCHTSNWPENMEAYKNPTRLAQYLALGKARDVAKHFSDAIIIGADTFITVGQKKIGKPATRAEAYQIIETMSGKTINVHSGLAVIRTDQSGQIVNEQTEHVLTKLAIKKMTSDEIRTLAEAEEALQISGAFSIEGQGGAMVERINGDYDNVIGLPVFRLKGILKDWL